MYSDFQGDNQNDSWIFALAILLSSTFVYNSMGTINQQAMDQLQYLFWVQTSIRVRVRGETSINKNSCLTVSPCEPSTKRET